MAKGFAASIRQHSDNVLKSVNNRAVEAVKFLFTKVVEYTPSPTNKGNFATGWLVNQWYPDIKGFSEELSGAKSDTGAGSLSRIQKIPAGLFYKNDTTVTLTNNVHYVNLAENLGWEPPNWSGDIGPYRMVYRAIQTTMVKYK
jgi:hypothetical protein